MAPSSAGKVADAPQFRDASALATWLSGAIRDLGLDVVDGPMIDVSTGDASVEMFDAAGRQFILRIQDPRPE